MILILKIILTSLDTSGKYGTDTGLSGGTVLTNTAITNLKAKDWQVNINGVLQ